MQSSPPTRSVDRPPSPTESQYSLDLAALDLDSGHSTPVALPHVDHVFSEDVDGPSDFTLNMDAWMKRGGTLARGTRRSGKGTTEMPMDVVERLKEQNKIRGENGDSVAPESARNDVDLSDDGNTASHHTPETSPPKDSVWKEGRYKGADGQPDSDGITDAKISTLQPSMPRDFLQPTVEEYHSELSPARFRPTPLQPSFHYDPSASPRSPEEASTRKSTKSSSNHLSRPISSPTSPPIHSPTVQRTVQTSRSGHSDQVEEQLLQLQDRCSQLEERNAVLSLAIDEQRRVRRPDDLEPETPPMVVARFDREPVEMEAAMSRHVEDPKFAGGENECSPHVLVDLVVTHGREMERLKQVQEIEVRRFKHQVEQQKAEHDRQLRGIEQELRLARRERDDAEEEARARSEQLHECHDSHEAEIHRLKLELQEAEEVRLTVGDLQKKLQDANEEKASLQAARKADENAALAACTELANLKQTQSEQIIRAESDRFQAVGLAEARQKSLKDLHQKLGEDQVAHDAEIERLRASHEKSKSDDAAELNSLRDEIETKQTLLNDAILERDAVQDDLSAARTTADALRFEYEALKEKLTDAEAVNREFDLKISDAMRKREAFWRSKLDESEKERVLTAKALLHQWGKAELGMGMPQGYEYKYLTRRRFEQEAQAKA